MDKGNLSFDFVSEDNLNAVRESYIALGSNPELTEVKFEVDSTMNVARILAEDYFRLKKPLKPCFGLAQGVVQTNGRGTHGRQWYTKPGQVAVTFIFNFEDISRKFEGLSLAVGAEVARVFEAIGVKINLKWPNDILLAGRDKNYKKVGGILVEFKQIKGSLVALVGIGINLTDYPKNLPHVSSLRKNLGFSISCFELVEKLVPRFINLKKKYPFEGFGLYKNTWLRFGVLDKIKFVKDASGKHHIPNSIHLEDNGSLVAKIKDRQIQIVSTAQLVTNYYD